MTKCHVPSIKEVLCVAKNLAGGRKARTFYAVLGDVFQLFLK